jgi:hypothetical protein
VNPVELGAPAFFALTLVSIVCGIGVSLLFSAFSDEAAVQRSRNLLISHLLEFRLFLDEPKLILRAQWAVGVQSVHLVKLLLRPALITTVPMLFLLSQVDAFLGRAPLRVGEDSVVTIKLLNERATPALDASEHIAVDTPGVHVIAERQVSWRFRCVRPGADFLRFHDGEIVVGKQVRAGTGIHYLSDRRTASIPEWLIHPTESPIPFGSIRWIEVRYPPAVIFGIPWIVWFLLISGAVAVLPKSRWIIGPILRGAQTAARTTSSSRCDALR